MKYEKIIPIALPLASLVRRHKLIAPDQKLSCTPFFILGSGRNGSTLLSAMINQHSKIVVPPEQYFLHLSYLKYRLLNILEWKDIVKIVFGEAMNPQTAPFWNVHLGNQIPVMYDLPKSERSLARLIDEVFRSYAEQQKPNFQMWGDKTPKNILYTKYIYKTFPDAKFIFLKRDGRDVVSSYMKGDESFFGQYNTLENASNLWNKSFEMWDWLTPKLSENQKLVINYEDLVADGEKTLTEVTQFLGFNFEEAMTSNYQSQADILGVSDAKAHKNVSKQLSSSSVGKWTERLTEQQVRDVDQIIGENLIKHGYK